MTWSSAPLSKVAALERNSISPADIKSGSRYVGLDHIEAGGGSIKFSSVTNGELASNKFQFGPNHILFGKLRPYLAKVVCPDFEGICSTDIIPIAPSKHVDKRYLLHFLRRPETIAWATGRATGVNLPRLSPKELASLEIPLPSLDEQRRIAAILDKAEALRRKRKMAIDLLGGLSQSIFQEMFGSLRSNSRGWDSANITDVCELIVDCVNRTAPVVEHATPYKMLRTTNVRNGIVDVENGRFVTKETFDKWNRRAIPRRGDVLLTREAPVGGVGMLATDDQVFLGQRLMLYRPKRGVMTSEFLVWLFSDRFLRDQFDRMGSGSTVKHLPLPACRAFEVRAPPMALQKLFSERINLLKRTMSVGVGYDTRISKLFSSLQSRAFSGQL